MTDLGAVRSQPDPAVARLRAAWSGVHPAARLAAVSAVLVSIGVGLTVPAPQPIGVAVALAGSLLAAAGLVDVHEHRLPNVLLAAAATVTIAGAITSWQSHRVATMAIGTALATAAMLIVRVGRGVGMGDVKMAGVVGGSSGAVMLAAAPLALAVGALAAACFGWLARRDRLPLGPFLWFGWVLAMGWCSTRWAR